MDKYKKIIYGECMFRIEEEFKTLEDAKNSSPTNKAVYKVDNIKVVRTLIKIKDSE
jgi:hypothetical protein